MFSINPSLTSYNYIVYFSSPEMVKTNYNRRLYSIFSLKKQTEKVLLYHHRISINARGVGFPPGGLGFDSQFRTYVKLGF